MVGQLVGTPVERTITQVFLLTAQGDGVRGAHYLLGEQLDQCFGGVQYVLWPAPRRQFGALLRAKQRNLRDRHIRRRDHRPDQGLVVLSHARQRRWLKEIAIAAQAALHAVLCFLHIEHQIVDGVEVLRRQGRDL